MDNFRRVLKIRIYQDNRITVCRVDPGSYRNLVPEVPCKTDNFNP